MAVWVEPETGQRGYLITGDRKYLETYKAAAAQIHEQLAQLHDLTVDNPQQQRRVARLDALLQTRLDRLQRNASVRQTKGFESAQQIVGTDEGQGLMEQIRDTAQAMEATEKGLLAFRGAESADSLRLKNVTDVIGTLPRIGDP